MEIQNIQGWANQPELEAWDAACLICGFEPGTVEKGCAGYNLAATTYRRLAADIEPCRTNTTSITKTNYATGKVKSTPIKAQKYYSREDLKGWAERNELGPKFLFIDGAEDEIEVNGKSREYLLRTIGALSLALIKKADGKKFGTPDKPNRNAIFSEIDSLLSQMGVSTDGQGSSNLSKLLGEAIDLAMKKPIK